MELSLKLIKFELFPSILSKYLKLGIYLQVASLKIFIASQRIPSDMKFYELENSYKSEDGLQM